MKTKHLLTAAALAGLAAGAANAASIHPGKPAVINESSEHGCGANGCSAASCSGKPKPSATPTPKPAE